VEALNCSNFLINILTCMIERRIHISMRAIYNESINIRN